MIKKFEGFFTNDNDEKVKSIVENIEDYFDMNKLSENMGDFQYLYNDPISKIDKTIKVWGYRESAHFITYRLSINDRIIRCSTYIIRDLMNFFYFKKYGRMPYTQ